MRCDKGTENTMIGLLQQFFRWDHNDEFAGRKSFVSGKSSANQRIEAWWSKVREGAGGWWVNLFKDLRDLGLFTRHYLHTQCLKFCFIPIIRKELRLVATLWNTHNIQRQRRCEVEGGKPDVMFFMPEAHGSNDYLSYVDMQDVTDCKEIYAEACADYDNEINELITLLKPDYVPPLDEYEALELYVEIMHLLENV